MFYSLMCTSNWISTSWSGEKCCPDQSFWEAYRKTAVRSCQPPNKNQWVFTDFLHEISLEQLRFWPMFSCNEKLALTETVTAIFRADKALAKTIQVRRDHFQEVSNHRIQYLSVVFGRLRKRQSWTFSPKQVQISYNLHRKAKREKCWGLFKGVLLITAECWVSLLVHGVQRDLLWLTAAYTGLLIAHIGLDFFVAQFVVPNAARCTTKGREWHDSGLACRSSSQQWCFAEFSDIKYLDVKYSGPESERPFCLPFGYQADEHMASYNQPILHSPAHLSSAFNIQFFHWLHSPKTDCSGCFNSLLSLHCSTSLSTHLFQLLSLIILLCLWMRPPSPPQLFSSSIRM